MKCLMEKCYTYINDNSVLQVTIIALLEYLSAVSSCNLIFGILTVLFIFDVNINTKSRIYFLVKCFIGLFISCVVISTNKFFIQYSKLLVLLSAYYGLFHIIYFWLITTVKNYKFSILFIFARIVVFIGIIQFSSIFFPFLYTQNLYCINMLNFFTKNMFPMFTEALFACVCLFVHKSFRIKKILRADILAIILLLVLSFCFSVVLQNILACGYEKKNKEIHIGFIQGAYTDSDYAITKTYTEYSKIVSEYYQKEANKLTQCDLIIFPESSCPLSNDGSMAVFEKMKKRVEEDKVNLIVNYHLNNEGKTKDDNIMFLIDTYGNTQKHTKMNLIPFAETDNTEKGEKNTDGFVLNEIIINPMICYESVFARNYLRLLDCDLIIVISNDSFSDNTIISDMHKAYTIQNAKMFKKTLVFVSGSGESFFVDSNGKITTLAKHYERKTGKYCVYL